MNTNARPALYGGNSMPFGLMGTFINLKKRGKSFSVYGPLSGKAGTAGIFMTDVGPK